MEHRSGLASSPSSPPSPATPATGSASTPRSTHRLELSAPPGDADLVSGLLAGLVSFGWEEQGADDVEPIPGDAGASPPDGRTRFVVHCDDPAFLQGVADRVRSLAPNVEAALDEVPATDWLAAWKVFFEPVSCGGRFVVLPPWRADEEGFEGRTRVLVEPGGAFGTGHHATTALVLAAISDLLDAGGITPQDRFLDLGTGSGILAIACCTQGLQGLALDVDPVAVDNARANAALNGVTGLRVESGSLELAQGPYDLVLANILAGPLIAMAADIVALLAADGRLVLSGILSRQAGEVEAAYGRQGLGPARIVTEGEWVALVWEGGRHVH